MVSIDVIGYEIKNGVVEYVFVIHDRMTKLSWSFKRRYSSLLDLHSSLRKIVPNLMEFPPKRWCGNSSPLFIEKRLQDIKYYFQEITELEVVRKHPRFKEFLTPEDRVPASSYEKSPEKLNFQKQNSPKINPQLAEVLETIAQKTSEQLISVYQQPQDYPNVETNKITEIQLEIPRQDLACRNKNSEHKQIDDDMDWIHSKFESLNREVLNYELDFPDLLNPLR